MKTSDEMLEKCLPTYLEYDLKSLKEGIKNKVSHIDCLVNSFKYYGGKNGGKFCIIYNNEDYMLKFPSLN